MSSDDPRLAQTRRPPQSRLARAPLTGIGAGDAAMQAASGSANPGVDAATAGLPPEARDAAMQAEATQAQEVEDRRVEMIGLLRSGDWRIPGDNRAVGQQVEAVEGADVSMINFWYGELQASRAARVQDEVEEETNRLGRLFTIGPAHPDYNVVQDTERRARIEKGLAPLDFAQLMLKGYVDQVVEIRPGFGIVLRSLTTRQGLWLERLAGERLPSKSALEAQHLYGVWQVAVALHAYVIAGKKEPVAPDLSTFVKEEQYADFVQALDLRVSQVGDRPIELTQDFLAQFIWFCGRVRLLIAGDVVGRLGNS